MSGGGTGSGDAWYGSGQSSTVIRSYAKESFLPWAHPLTEEIDGDDICASYGLFIPMTTFRRGAIGFRDLTQTPDLAASAAGYCTALQLLGECMRFLTQCGTAPEDCKTTFTLMRKNGETVTLPKARFIMHLVVTNTRPHIGAGTFDILPEHELINPNNLLGIHVMILVHDPKLRLINLLEKVVAENANNQPTERRVHLLEELKVAQDAAAPPQPFGEGEGDADDEEAQEDQPRRPRGRQAPKRKPPPSANFRKRTDYQKKDPIEPFLTYEGIDELWRAVALLVDIATGTTDVSGSRKYQCRSDLMTAIASTTDPKVNLEERMSLRATIERIKAYADSVGAYATSEQLYFKEYFKVVAVPWESWMTTTDDADADPAATADTPPCTPPSTHPDSAEKELFHLPIPSLAWELTPQQASARRLMRVTFPWKRSDSGMIFASIAARTLNVSVDEILQLANISGGRRQRRSAGESANGVANAGRIAAMIGIRQPGGDPGGATWDTMETEQDWSPYPTLGVAVVVSKTRPLGRKANAIKSAVRRYVARRVSDLEKEIDSYEGNGSSRNRNRRRQSSQDGSAGEGRRARRRRRTVSGYISDEEFGPSPFDEDDEDEGEAFCQTPAVDDALAYDEIAKRKADIKDVKKRGFMAIAEIEQAALTELITLLETSACVPDAVKACSMWVNRHEYMDIDYDVVFKDVGVFGQLAGSMMLTFKKYGVATGQWPVFLLMVARDTGYTAHLIGRLCINTMIRGKYAGGKSLVMEILDKLSLKCSINTVTGSSAQGMLPIHAEENKPEGFSMALYDELPPVFTTPTARMSMADQRTARQLAAFMTKKEINYVTNEKGLDNKIRPLKRVVEANIPMAGACNDTCSGAAIEARMVSVFMHPNVPGPRNAMNVMCNEAASNGRDAGERASIEMTMFKQQALSMLTALGMEAGSIPLPDNVEFCRTMASAIEYLQLNYPYQAQKVRMVDVALSMAVVLSIWTAVVLAFSKGFRRLDAAGVPEETRSTSAPFDIMNLRDDIIGYLKIDPDVTMFVIAYAVYYSSQPEGNIILRWLTERQGLYPFVGECKAVLKLFEGGDEDKDDEEATEGAESANAAAAAAAAAVAAAAQQPTDDPRFLMPNGERRIRVLEDVAAELLKYQKYGVLNISTEVKRAGGAGGRSRARRGRGGDDPNATAEQKMLTEFVENEGTTVTMSMDGRRGTKLDQLQVVMNVLNGTAEAPYEYKPEVVKIDGTPAMFYNPNYIFVPGTVETLCQAFVRGNGRMKLNEGQVRDELKEFEKNTVLAHALPLVPFDRKKVLVEIEAYRVHLWATRGLARRTSLPVIIHTPRPGIYVLIEALLDSPKRIVHKVLRHVCNETTVDRRVVLPIPDKHCPEVFKTFHARPVKRALHCANSSYMRVAMGALPHNVREQAAISQTNCDDAVLEWRVGSEHETFKRYLQENGALDKNPGDYTYEAIYKSRVIARQQQHAVDGEEDVMKAYPRAFTDAVKEFDRRTKMAQQEDDNNDDEMI